MYLSRNCHGNILVDNKLHSICHILNCWFTMCFVISSVFEYTNSLRGETWPTQCQLKAFKTCHSRTMTSFAIPFLNLHACTQSTKQWNVVIAQDRWIRNIVWMHGGDRESQLCQVHWLCAWTDDWVSDSSAHTAYNYWRRLASCCSVIDGKLHLRHSHAASNKSDINKTRYVREEM